MPIYDTLDEWSFSVIIIQISLSRGPCKPLVALKARESVDFTFVFTISVSRLGV